MSAPQNWPLATSAVTSRFVRPVLDSLQDLENLRHKLSRDDNQTALPIVRGATQTLFQVFVNMVSAARKGTEELADHMASIEGTLKPHRKHLRDFPEYLQVWLDAIKMANMLPGAIQLTRRDVAEWAKWAKVITSALQIQDRLHGLVTNSSSDVLRDLMENDDPLGMALWTVGSENKTNRVHRTWTECWDGITDSLKPLADVNTDLWRIMSQFSGPANRFALDTTRAVVQRLTDAWANTDSPI